MIVELADVSKEMKGARVLDGINARFESGRVYGLRGKNGAGKTMLMRLMAGLVSPTSGRVVVDGKVLRKGEFPRDLGLMIENPSFIPQYSGFKNLWYLALIKGVVSADEVRAAIARVGLDPQDDRPFRKYSLGMKQRLGIACAVMERPAIVLLDEPTNALDPAGVETVGRIISEERGRGALVVVSCHDEAELESCSDEILVMAEGKIVERVAIGGSRHE